MIPTLFWLTNLLDCNLYLHNSTCQCQLNLESDMETTAPIFLCKRAQPSNLNRNKNRRSEYSFQYATKHPILLPGPPEAQDAGFKGATRLLPINNCVCTCPNKLMHLMQLHDQYANALASAKCCSSVIATISNSYGFTQQGKVMSLTPLRDSTQFCQAVLISTVTA